MSAQVLAARGDRTHITLKEAEVLPFDAAAARWLGSESARLSLIGRAPSLPDGQTAAVAATRGFILVTRNVRHFEGFQGLEVQNWFETEPAT